ncbi:hypothetical protein FGIG_04648 [Fasciola gigantica]|uniref:Uncharacterized protein n=1 Tax=Fasciola gigantica TaxID=46835 RepID=A0A504YIR1_FASGI|nr:hypothetical protein FGIG_04648 [Fasciola gigantica]
MRSLSLRERLDANRSYQQSGPNGLSHTGAPVGLSLSIDQAVALVRNAHDRSDTNPEIFLDVCKLINGALLFKLQQSGVSEPKPPCINAIGWTRLVTDTAFLNGLLLLICHGFGLPVNQEAGSVLMCNLCMVVFNDFRFRTNLTAQQRAALERMIYHVVGSLLIVISRPQLTRLASYAAHSLRYLVMASKICGSLAWFQSSLLIPHVIGALKMTLPPALLRPVLTNHEVSEHTARLRRIISEADIDLTTFSSLFELVTSCISILFTSDSIHLTSEEQHQFRHLFQTGLVNLLFAMAAYWPCESCRNKSTTLWDVSNSSSFVENASCQALWDELDEEVMYTIEIVLRCAFHISASSPDACCALFLHDEHFAQVLVQLMLSVTRCRSSTLPSLTTKCVIYAFRLLGQIFSLPNPHRCSSSIDLYMILAMCELSCWWLSTHMDWTLCAAEVCSTMANTVAYFSPAPTQLWLNPVGQLYVSRCLLPSLSISFACGQSLRLIFNLLSCDKARPLMISVMCLDPIRLTVLLRLDRLVHELITLSDCLSDITREPKWMSECASQLLDICELLCAHRSFSIELMDEPTASRLPNLFRLFVGLGKVSVRQTTNDSLRRFVEIFAHSSIRE